MAQTLSFESACHLPPPPRSVFLVGGIAAVDIRAPRRGRCPPLSHCRVGRPPPSRRFSASFCVEGTPPRAFGHPQSSAFDYQVLVIPFVTTSSRDFSSPRFRPQDFACPFPLGPRISGNLRFTLVTAVWIPAPLSTLFPPRRMPKFSYAISSVTGRGPADRPRRAAGRSRFSQTTSDGPTLGGS